MVKSWAHRWRATRCRNQTRKSHGAHGVGPGLCHKDSAAQTPGAKLIKNQGKGVTSVIGVLPSVPSPVPPVSAATYWVVTPCPHRVQD